MERLLNDVRMSFFGSQAMDFNYDGLAESSANGWDDGYADPAAYASLFGGSGGLAVTGGKPMSGTYHPAHKSGGSTVSTTDGQAVITALDGSSMETEVDAWRDDLKGWFPIRYHNGRQIGFSATGRLSMDKSVNYRVWIRGQVWDNLQNVQVTESNYELCYALDPNRDGDVSDSHITLQRAFKNMVTFKSPGDL